MNYGIFRSQQIMTINDLAQIGSHNKREKKAYKSNPDIKLELTKNNIELVPLTEKYVKGFYNLTKEYKKEHDERMKTERENRKKRFKQMLDKSNNVIADELMFTATTTIFPKSISSTSFSKIFLNVVLPCVLPRNNLWDTGIPLLSMNNPIWTIGPLLFSLDTPFFLNPFFTIIGSLFSSLIISLFSSNS